MNIMDTNRIEVKCEEKKKTCTKCKKEKCYSEFTSRAGNQTTRCNHCRRHRYCIHDNRKAYCYECQGVLGIARKMRSNAQGADLTKFGSNKNLIKTETLVQLLKGEKACCYCTEPFQYGKYHYRMPTIQRLDNDIGHTANNVTLCCLQCNTIDGINYQRGLN